MFPEKAFKYVSYLYVFSNELWDETILYRFFRNSGIHIDEWSLSSCRDFFWFSSESEFPHLVGSREDWFQDYVEILGAPRLGLGREIPPQGKADLSTVAAIRELRASRPSVHAAYPGASLAHYGPTGVLGSQGVGEDDARGLVPQAVAGAPSDGRDSYVKESRRSD